MSFRLGFSRAMAKRQRCARIIMYHGATAEAAIALREQLAYLTRSFRVVSLERVVDRLARKAGPDANEIVLTFDDGLRNHLAIVYPILRELQAPATFFVCPGLLGRGRWLWNHEARCRLEMLSGDRWEALRGRFPMECTSVERIIDWMKGLRLSARAETEKLIRLATPEFAPTATERQAYDLMDWDDLLSLDPGLITIGSHSLTHPILTTLDAARLDVELADSRVLLEQRLNRPVSYFCYPNGAHHEQVRYSVKKLYRAAVTTESGPVPGGNRHDLHLLPRIPGAESAALMAWRLHRPGA